MVAWVLIFLFAVVMDVGAVMFTRSVQLEKVLYGAVTTGVIALSSWLSVLAVVDHGHILVIPSVVGHVTGFVVGMKIPVRTRSQTDGPTPD